MNNSNGNELILTNDGFNNGINTYDKNFEVFLNGLGLPSDRILAPVPERIKVLKNINDVLENLDPKRRNQSPYISKFLGAVGAGLFDAALNYLWDETIHQLRKTVVQFDLEYFYDLISKDSKKKYSSEEELVKVEDSVLIEGCRKMELISSVGYHHLDHIKYMRNWASAAHPNHVDVTGFQLIDWLDTCIREVISLPLSTVTISTKKLLENIKTESLDSEKAKKISAFFSDLTPERAEGICSGLFGIYCRDTSSTESRKNIKLLLPSVWEKLDESSKYSYGIKYGLAQAHNEQNKATLAREFLQIVNGESYIPDNIKSAELSEELDNLHLAHISFNNFYTEPGPARQIQRLVNENGVPINVLKKYSLTLTEVYLTNGYGACWEADEIYKKLINMFSDQNYVYVVTAFLEENVYSKLQTDLCETRYVQLLEQAQDMVVMPKLKDLISKILSSSKKPSQLMDDKGIQKMAQELRTDVNIR